LGEEYESRASPSIHLALMAPTLQDLVDKLRSFYEDGITSNPGYALGDRLAMALSTKKDIDNLPDTEGNSEHES